MNDIKKKVGTQRGERRKLERGRTNNDCVDRHRTFFFLYSFFHSFREQEFRFYYHHLRSIPRHSQPSLLSLEQQVVFGGWTLSMALQRLRSGKEGKIGGDSIVGPFRPFRIPCVNEIGWAYKGKTSLPVWWCLCKRVHLSLSFLH